MDIYQFEELHITGGDATIRISEKQIIEYMKSLSIAFLANSDEDIVKEFIRVNWAYKICEEHKVDAEV